METILIPSYKDLKRGIALNIDRFCGYVTSLNFTMRLQTAEYRVEPKLNYILRKIIKDNDIHNNGLMRLLGSCTMEILKYTSEHEINERDLKSKQMKVKFEETLDRSYKNELKTKIDELEKLKKIHINIMRTLIEKQMVLWKMNKRETKLKLLDKAKMDYLITIGKEEKVRSEMKEIIENINTSVKAKITNRLETSIETLRWLAADFISYERSDEMLSRINGLDIAAVTEDIIESFCKRYRYAVPSDYFHFLDFDYYLLKEPQKSDPEKLKLCIDILEDKILSDCLYLQQFLANKKSGIRRFFNIIRNFGSKHATKTLNDLYSEELKEMKNKNSIYQC